MRDPFQVLGVNPNSTDEEIYNAYIELSKKYNADNYISSSMQDIAKEKMEELNQAYDQIVEIRQSNSQTFNQNQNYNQGYNSYSNFNYCEFADMRNLINMGRFDDAEELLNGVPVNIRNAEWNFLKGKVFHSRGYLDDAYSFFKVAVNMDPLNQEYQAAFNSLTWSRSGNMNGNPYKNRYNSMGCDFCDICTGLLVADCCCECMGGDLIGCC